MVGRTVAGVALSRFHFEVDTGDQTVVIEGEGVVDIQGAPAGGVDVGQAIADFLAQLDPAMVERAALARQGWGSGAGSLTGDILATVADIACGNPAVVTGAV